MRFQFLLEREVETWDRNDRGREFHRREVQKLKTLEPVAV